MTTIKIRTQMLMFAFALGPVSNLYGAHKVNGCPSLLV